jgi:hypothetical protein
VSSHPNCCQILAAPMDHLYSLNGALRCPVYPSCAKPRSKTQDFHHTGLRAHSRRSFKLGPFWGRFVRKIFLVEGKNFCMSSGFANYFCGEVHRNLRQVMCIPAFTGMKVFRIFVSPYWRGINAMNRNLGLLPGITMGGETPILEESKKLLRGLWLYIYGGHMIVRRPYGHETNPLIRQPVILQGTEPGPLANPGVLLDVAPGYPGQQNSNPFVEGRPL